MRTSLLVLELRVGLNIAHMGGGNCRYIDIRKEKIVLFIFSGLGFE